MNRTAQKLGLETRGMLNAETMELYLQDEFNLISILGGIQFNDLLSGNVSLPQDLHAAIRFPAELRTTFSVISLATNSWRTNLLFPQIQFAGPRNPASNFTAPPSKYNFLLTNPV